MQFGNALGTACLTFAVTNVDDMFVLVTFFTEASTSQTLTPLKITLGQYVGFTVIVVISMIGFGISLAVPSEPIGFLGLLPILLGTWKFLGLVFEDKEEESEESSHAVLKSVFKVSSITVMNGGDNIGTYVPLFSQTRGAEIAVYVVTYYILLGVWCFIAYLVMRQKHILRVFQRYADLVIPFLYMGLGVYIVVQSDCYLWAIEHIDNDFYADPGQTIMAIITAFFLLTGIVVMLLIKLWKRRAQAPPNAEEPVQGDHAFALGNAGESSSTRRKAVVDGSSPGSEDATQPADVHREDAAGTSRSANGHFLEISPSIR